MEHGKTYTFQDFILDLDNANLSRGQRQLRLRPKAFAMLCYFVERPGQLVTKDELFRALWPNIVIDGATLTGCIRELRTVLNDSAKQPRFIETIPTKGYRFIAAVQRPKEERQKAKNKKQKAKVETISPAPNTQHPAPVLVGRDAELASLHSLLEKARTGQRHVVFVTGEPGIGKTTLIEAFLHSLASSVQCPASEEHEESQIAKACPEPSRRVKLQKSKFSETQSSALSPQSLLSPNPRLPTPSPWIGRGQCVKQYGVDEAYLPVFEALSQLSKEENGERLIAVLRQYAPTWVVQMPGVLSPPELDVSLPRVAGATRERMLRELAEAIEVVTREHLLVLWFDDLHDSDPSTLDLIAYLARRQHPARMLLIGTYRPAEALSHAHGLPRVQQELRERRQWQEVALAGLDEPAIERYLKARLAGETRVSFAALAHALYRRTEGNPLFLVSLVEDLQAQQLLVLQEEQWQLRVTLQEVVSRVPATLHGTLTGQFQELQSEEQTVLEAASVAGLHFTVPVVSAATGKSLLEVEEICESLARRERFISRDGTEEWPDATLATCYRFRHALHQEISYQRIPPLKRSHWHQKIGERREQAFATEVGTVAVELAAHFEHSRDYERAARYLQHAGAQAVRRSAYNEALSLATRGVALLRQLPDSPQRTQLELGLHMVLASSLSVTRGASAIEVGQSYHRALELCRQEREEPQIFPALAGLFGFYLVRAEYQAAYELGEQLLHLAERQPTSSLRLMAHLALGVTLLFRGEFPIAASHFAQRSPLYDPRDHLTAMYFGHDPAVTTLSFGAFGRWFLGHPAQAVQMGREGVALAKQLSHPYSENVAGHFLAQIFQCCHKVSAVLERVETNLVISNEQGFLPGLALNAMLQGWARAEQGDAAAGIAQIHQGLTTCEVIGTKFTLSYHLALLAEAYARAERWEEGLVVLNNALQHIEKTGERYYEAEIYRLYGELLLAQEIKSQKAKGKKQKSENTDPRPLIPDPQGEAEACFLKAIDIARRQQAKSLELRAVMSLVRLRQHQASEDGSRNTNHASRTKLAEAHLMLSEVYNWFTEGFDTKDLQEAKALLVELSKR